jgi:putative NIF3 family GTP cyclohydrolase 1 type 2
MTTIAPDSRRGAWRVPVHLSMHNLQQHQINLYSWHTPYMLYHQFMTGKQFKKQHEDNGWLLDRISGSHHIMI